jgi:hypothetical protein
MYATMLRPEEEDAIAEALEQLRISYNQRQWRVCSLVCEMLAEKFKSLAEKNLASKCAERKHG